jgi:hypothetical protein
MPLLTPEAAPCIPGRRVAALACLLLACAPPETAAHSSKVAMIEPAPGKQGNPQVTYGPQAGIVLAGEALCIQTPSDPSLPINHCFPVDKAGHADLPWLGRYAVGGRQPRQIEADLALELSERLRGVPVRVSPALRLGYLGAWARPGEHILPMDATLWDALLAAGGPSEGTAAIQVLRGSELLFQVNMAGTFAREAVLSNVGIRSGDLFLLHPGAVAPQRSTWDIIKESLAVSAQVCAVMGSLLSTWLTWDYLKKNGAI